jgi:hypothetical protein
VVCARAGVVGNFYCLHWFASQVAPKRLFSGCTTQTLLKAAFFLFAPGRTVTIMVVGVVDIDDSHALVVDATEWSVAYNNALNVNLIGGPYTPLSPMCRAVWYLQHIQLTAAMCARPAPC